MACSPRIDLGTMRVQKPLRGARGHSISRRRRRHRPKQITRTLRNTDAAPAGGNISLHGKCMLAPPTVIDYIVVPELTTYVTATTPAPSATSSTGCCPLIRIGGSGYA